MGNEEAKDTMSSDFLLMFGHLLTQQEKLEIVG